MSIYTPQSSARRGDDSIHEMRNFDLPVSCRRLQRRYATLQRSDVIPIGGVDHPQSGLVDISEIVLGRHDLGNLVQNDKMLTKLLD